MNATPHAATIGRPIRLEGLVLPGTKLEPKADSGRTAPVAIRIIDVAPHGDLLRYDLEVTVWEPGKHDVRAYLERVDGSAMGDLPEIPVEAASVLAAGAPRVSTPEPMIPGNLGGYRELAIGAAAVWLAGLLAILFLVSRRRGPTAMAETAAAAADRLAELVARARGGAVGVQEEAAIERLVYEAWQDELGLGAASPKALVEHLRRDERARAALDRLAAWLHAPAGEAPADIASFVEAILPPQRLDRAGRRAAETVP